jgi:hypothetical protein
MITIREYARMLEMEQDIIHIQSEGLGDAELLLQPSNGGNCMEWILGHIADGLKTILRVLDALPPQGLPDLSRYRRGSEPILGPEPGLLGRASLLEALDMLHAAVQTRLAELDEAAFDEEIIIFGDQAHRRGWWALFFLFHHSYHVGQLEILRNLAGRTEKLI